MEDQNAVRPDERKPWEEPVIVLERALEAAAGGTPPTASGRTIRQGRGFLGPLGTSGVPGLC